MSRTFEDLRLKQSLPLDLKISLTRDRIRQWVNEFGEEGVYVSFSGGKDSTVLLDIVRNVCGYKDIPAVFVDVPTQYPELKEFATSFDNVEVLKPKISFMEVCSKYGFPLISKEVSKAIYESKVGNAKYRKELLEGTALIPGTDRLSPFNMSQWKFLMDAPFNISHKCCGVMKKAPLHDYTKKTGRLSIKGQMAAESRRRRAIWLQHGCNMFDLKEPKSNPLSFWTENDVLEYIAKNKIKICSVYGDVVEDFGDQLEGQMDFSDFGLYPSQKKYKCTGCRRTGCMLCGFGCHLENEENSRLLRLKKTHPKMYALIDVIKNNGFTFKEACVWINEHINGRNHIYL